MANANVGYRCRGGYSAWLINGRTLTTNVQELYDAIKYDIPVVLITKGELELMAACDFGHQWEEIAKAPVRFTIEQLEKALAA